MAKLPLTTKFVESATSKGAVQADYFDSSYPGLCLRVTDKGKRTWTYVFTAPDGKRARMTLGIFPALSLVDAREAWKGVRNKTDARIDPREQSAAVKTVAEMFQDRLRMEILEQRHPKTDELVRPGLRTAKMIEDRFKRNVEPVVGKIAVKDFEISHLNRVLDPILERGAMRVAGQVYIDLNALFKFAKRRGEVKFNPISDAKPNLTTNVRDRFLSVEEIAAFWRNAPVALGRSQMIEAIMKLCLVLGRRLNEVAGMRREEVDLYNKVWVIPKSRVKSTERKAKDFVCPLSDLAVSILRDVMRKHNYELVFAKLNKGGHGYTPTQIDQTIRRANAATDDEHPLGMFGTAKWTPHDLRRTFGTQVLNSENKLGVSRFDRSLVLNHTSVTKETVSDQHYDMNAYFEEKRIVIDKWGAFLAQLVGENVVEMGRAA